MPAVPIIGIALGATGAITAAGSAIAATLGFATVSAVTATAIGGAAFAGAATLATGGSASQALRNAVVGGVSGFAGNYVGNYIGSAVGGATGSTVAANVAASAASAGVRAGITGQDIGSAILGGAVGAGIDMTVGTFGLPLPIQNAASSALRAAYSDQDIPQAVFGSFAGYAAKELGKDFEAQFNSTHNDLAENFQQQTAAVDSYNNLVSEFKDWDAGYQNHMATLSTLDKQVQNYYSLGVRQRSAAAEAALNKLINNEVAKANDYVSRYNAAWAEKSPMLDELKSDITALQTEGGELSQQYDTLYTDAVKTFEDLAVKFRDAGGVVPEPVYEEEVVPEPVYEEEVVPEPVYEEEVVPEPVYEEEVVPEPIPTPEPVYEEELPTGDYNASDWVSGEELPTGEYAPAQDPGWVSGEELPTGDYNLPEVEIRPPAITRPVTRPVTRPPNRPAAPSVPQTASQQGPSFDMLMQLASGASAAAPQVNVQGPAPTMIPGWNPVSTPYGGPSLFASGGSVPDMYAVNQELLRMLRG